MFTDLGLLIRQRGEPCPHERILKPPGRYGTGKMLAQEMLPFERLERSLHRGAR
jgi:hypothetical protein